MRAVYGFYKVMPSDPGCFAEEFRRPSTEASYHVRWEVGTVATVKTGYSGKKASFEFEL